MKKAIGILLIITSLILLINSIIELTNYLEYFGEYYYRFAVFVPIANLFFHIAFFLLGISLLNEKKLPAVSKNESISDEVNLNSNDLPSTGLNIISFLIPIVGLILYLTEKDKSPRKAKSAGKAALWGVGVSLVLGLISVIISVAMVRSMY